MLSEYQKSICSVSGTVLEAMNKQCTEKQKSLFLCGDYILEERLYSRIKRQTLFSQYIIWFGHLDMYLGSVTTK